ncbi:tetratricopeptide repeat protein [Streptomyces silvensis]|uniref:tetratricopeptide repeat protein n=1 Tax=Streptomyces silvensis TaxID=1765722 RepID=UPI0012FE8C7F|nr:tetratricopeptide repeat protein [Streptomyces silvensis]
MDVAPELTLLRLLEVLGEAPEPLIGTVAAAPDALAPMLTALCREQLRTLRRPVVVLDGVPAGPPGTTLLRLTARILHGTDARVLATSASRHTGTGLRLISRKAPATGEGAAHPAPGRARLSAPAVALLDVLRRWDGEEFTAPVASALRGVDCRTAVRELCTGGLLQETRADRYRLHPAATAEARAAERTGAVTTLDGDLAAAVLDGRADLRDDADAYADLAVRLLCAHEPRGTALLAQLEPQLAGGQGLFRLLRVKQTLWHLTGDYEPVRVLIAVSTRETGNPTTASRVLKPAPSRRAALEEAVTLRHLGRLTDADAALVALDALPTRTPDGWALHTRAAIQCDMGTLTGADRLLRRAVEAHQVRGDRRGEAWAAHHYGRLRLLRGDTEEARKRLEAAQHTFADLGDLHGVAWSSTELARCGLVDGAWEEALGDLARAGVLHLRNHDVRGSAWARLYTGFAEAGARRPWAAKERFAQAFVEFWGVPDRLGAAWAQHCLGLANRDPGRRSPDAAFFLRRAWTDFTATGCPHGLAWSTLELAESERLTVPIKDSHSPKRYSAAQRQFAAIGDAAGELWVAVARRPRGPISPLLGGGVPRDLDRFYPSQVAAAFKADADIGIPLVARCTIPEPWAHVTGGDPPSVSRIHLVLLDDEATTRTASRIALHIDPGPDHPWSTPTADHPWLTARATPLTAADVEPAHAVTLKPSPRDPDGAEFLFTPRRAGRHRLLFTVEDSATATVLQQVETYIDVTDGEAGTPDAAGSPEALRRA